MDAPAPFNDPETTLDGNPRASIDLRRLDTLWFNTGTLCNLTCANCYIESSPRNDRLVYLTAGEVDDYLEEIRREELGTREIGFTGGEPFMNPELPAMLENALARGHEVLVLTNAMRPMMKCRESLRELGKRFGSRLRIRVSIDHYSAQTHEIERGRRSWKPTINGLVWLQRHGFSLSVAARTCWGETEEQMRAGFSGLFRELEIDLDVSDPEALVLFPEMDEDSPVPEITTGCWDILGKSPDDIMCAWSRMVIKRKGAEHPVVASCTLIPYDERFELSRTLKESFRSVPLNHPHCARFCVLGGGSCSRKE